MTESIAYDNEMPRRRPHELLEKIGVLMGCESLSDLHASPRLDRVLLAKKIELLSSQAFPLSEWTETACYITRVERTFACEQDAAEFLLRYLR